MLLKTLLADHLGKEGWGNISANGASSITIPSDFYVTPSGIAFIYGLPGIGGSLFQLPVLIPFSEFGDKIKKQSWME